MKTLLMILLTVLLAGCRTIPPSVQAKVEEKQTAMQEHESKEHKISYLYIRDSIVLKQAGDTIIKEKIQIRYRDRIQIKTDSFTRIDTLYFAKEIRIKEEASCMSIFWQQAGKILSGILLLFALFKCRKFIKL